MTSSSGPSTDIATSTHAAASSFTADKLVRNAQNMLKLLTELFACSNMLLLSMSTSLPAVASLDLSLKAG